MLLRFLVLAIAAVYVGYRGYLAVALVRARRAGDTGRERALRAHAFWSTRWLSALCLLALLFLLMLAWLSSRR